MENLDMDMLHKYDADWNFAATYTPYSIAIRQVGDYLYEVLKDHVYDTDGMKVRDVFRHLAGTPYDLNGLRGVFAYVSRKAVREGFVLVSVPVLEVDPNDIDPLKIVITDYETKLVPLEVAKRGL